MWRHIAQSAVGDAHVVDNLPCQDCCQIVVLGEDSNETLVACAADGAGSARHSEVGSALACDVILKCAAAYFERHRSLADLQRDEVLLWCEEAREKLDEVAAARGVELRELATTLCTALVSPSHSAFFQIGDGAIIVKRNGVCGVVFWPQSGEYANSTNFLTSNEFRDHFQFFSTASGFSDVAVLTDGMERLALRFDSRTPHSPFFEPLFQALRANEDSNDLSESLRRFLESDSVRSRSDDDKTLILASCIECERDSVA